MDTVSLMVMEIIYYIKERMVIFEMASIVVSGTSLSITNDPDILNGSIVLTFHHANGVVQLTVPHVLANVIRAHLQYSVDYPNCILPPGNPIKSTIGCPVLYTDIGDMVYNATMTVSLTHAFTENTARLTVTTFAFDLEPYIRRLEDQVEYIQPYYDYYNGKDTVIITFTKSIIDSICERMDQLLPYQRFGSLNAELYQYIKE